MSERKRVLIPIIIVMGFIPMIVRLVVYNTKLSDFEWFPNASEIDADTFLVWKMNAIICIGCLMTMILVYHLWKEKKMRSDASFYFLIFYALFVVMAALFSPYKYWVNRGVYGVQESLWVLLSYLVMCFYSYQAVAKEEQIEVIVKYAAVGVALIIVLGLMQFVGHDFFQTELGMKLLTGSGMAEQIERVDFDFEGSVISTLYNPDYCSFYFGMLIPISLCFIFALKKLWARLVAVVFTVLAIVCLYGAGVTTSWIAVLGTVLIVISVLSSRNRKLFWSCIGSYAGVFLIGVIILFSSTQGRRIVDLFVGTYDWGEEGYPVYNVRTEDDYALVNVFGEDIRISYEYDSIYDVLSISCADKDGKEIAREKNVDNERIEEFVDERFPGVCIIAGQQFEMPAVNLKVENSQWIFTKDIDGTYYYLNPAGKYVKTKAVKNASLFHEDALSGRGRIWNRTIPLLAKHFLVGSGANTFVFEYPQYDYLYRAQTGESNTLDVKAHNWYLQQMVETGVIGTVLLLVFLGWYVVKSIRIYRRADLHRSVTIMGLGFFAGVLVYLIAALANDSSVCTAPVFWCVLGLGMAVNDMIVKQEGLTIGRKVPETDGIEVGVTDSGQNSVRKSSGKKQSRKQRKKQGK